MQRNPSPSRQRRHRAGDGAGDAEGGQKLVFGRKHIIPKPFDERLLPEVATAVVEAAIATGVARLADLDLKEYKRSLTDLATRINM
jgi:malate dehydrogenase (oxaloacetate-decarboxylating)(NADP+)